MHHTYLQQEYYEPVPRNTSGGYVRYAVCAGRGLLIIGLPASARLLPSASCPAAVVCLPEAPGGSGWRGWLQPLLLKCGLVEVASSWRACCLPACCLLTVRSDIGNGPVFSTVVVFNPD
jgi:hypothetical protein